MKKKQTQLTKEIFVGKQIKIPDLKHKKKKRFVGYTIKGKKGPVFIIPRKSKHRLRLYDSWGLNELVLKDLRAKNYSEIRFVIDGGKRVLKTTPEHMISRGLPWRSEGYEPQIQLREKDFDKVYE